MMLNRCLAIFLMLCFTHTLVGLTSCISLFLFSLKLFDLHDHYAACCVPLKSPEEPYQDDGGTPTVSPYEGQKYNPYTHSGVSEKGSEKTGVFFPM